MTSFTAQDASDLFRQRPDRWIETRPGTEVAYRKVGTGPDSEDQVRADLHAKITVPALLVWGDDDPFFPLERTRAMMSGFRGPVGLTVIEGGRLFHHEEFPDQVAAALLPVLTAD
jgi:pimeloyl-ACP methyl ester carboxylesterase